MGSIYRYQVLTYFHLVLSTPNIASLSCSFSNYSKNNCDVSVRYTGWQNSFLRPLVNKIIYYINFGVSKSLEDLYFIREGADSGLLCTAWRGWGQYDHMPKTPWRIKHLLETQHKILLAVFILEENDMLINDVQSDLFHYIYCEKIIARWYLKGENTSHSFIYER